MNSIELRLLTLDEVAAKVSLKRTTIYARLKTGDFPRPVALGSRSTRWRSDEIDAWIERMTARGRAAA